MKKAFIAISTAFLLSWAQAPARAETKIPKCDRNQTTKLYELDKKSNGQLSNMVYDPEGISKAGITKSVHINDKFLTLGKEELHHYAENYARYLAQKEFALWLDSGSNDKGNSSSVLVAIAAKMLELCHVNNSQLLIKMELTTLGSGLANLLIDYENMLDSMLKAPTPATEAEWDKFEAEWIEIENHAEKLEVNIENYLIKNFSGQ